MNVSYLDGKGNLEPQGTGKGSEYILNVGWYLLPWLLQSCWSLLLPSFTVPSAVQTLSEDLLKYYQQITRAILGEDPHLMKVEFCPGVDMWQSSIDWRNCWNRPKHLIHGGWTISSSGGFAGSPVQLQDCCPPAVFCIRHQWGMLYLFETQNLMSWMHSNLQSFSFSWPAETLEDPNHTAAYN